MTRTIAEALMDEGELRGLKKVLRKWLEDRFAPLPEALLAQLDALTDLQRLEAAVRQAPGLQKLEDLHL